MTKVWIPKIGDRVRVTLDNAAIAFLNGGAK
jgi:hypothetical protein